MQPWKVSVGLTVTVAGLTAILLTGRLEYLAEFRRVILADYDLVIALYLGLALATRALGRGDLGKTVDLVERSVRRGEGDRELAEALQRDVEGNLGVIFDRPHDFNYENSPITFFSSTYNAATRIPPNSLFVSLCLVSYDLFVSTRLLIDMLILQRVVGYSFEE